MNGLFEEVPVSVQEGIPVIVGRVAVFSTRQIKPHDRNALLIAQSNGRPGQLHARESEDLDIASVDQHQTDQVSRARRR